MEADGWRRAGGAGIKRRAPPPAGHPRRSAWGG
jgi:hypothetical protein